MAVWLSNIEDVANNELFVNDLDYPPKDDVVLFEMMGDSSFCVS